MTRKFPISDIFHPTMTLRQSLQVEQLQVDGKWVAHCLDLPELDGKADNWPQALSDLQDNLVAAINAGDAKVAAFVRERDSAAVPSTPEHPATPSVGKRNVVYVLLETEPSDLDESVIIKNVEGVTADKLMAERYKKWSRGAGDFVECVMEELP